MYPMVQYHTLGELIMAQHGHLLFLSMEDNDGRFALSGFLASQLCYSGSLFQTSFEADRALAEFAGIIHARLWIAVIAPRCPT